MDPKVPNSPFRANFCRGWPKVLIYEHLYIDLDGTLDEHNYEHKFEHLDEHMNSYMNK